jgi:RIO kinase 1
MIKTPENLKILVDHGIIQEVLRPLMSGKEAQVYVVVAGGEECVAKVYKDASQRTFKHRAEYTEGRRTRNTRDQRAMNKRTRHGRKQDESAWRSAEVDMIYRLRDAGVRVPEPINFVDGVLVMELIKDAEGKPAPRLGDLSFEASEAHEIYQELIREAQRMLCAGVIHGDLSEFNVLMSADGPVVIDFPQSVDPAHNQNAHRLLLRDVDNLHRFLARSAPGQPTPAYAQEMWALFQANRLRPDTELRGNYKAPEGKTNTQEVLGVIGDANREEQERREGRRSPASPIDAPKPLRAVVDFTKGARPQQNPGKRSGEGRGAAPARRPHRAAEGAVAKAPSAAKGSAAPEGRRNRRRRKPRTEAPATASRNETTTLGRGEAERERRRGGGPARSKSGEGKAGVQSRVKRPAKPVNSAKPAKSAKGTRRSGLSAGGEGGEGRPARRRRRRRRAAGSREMT